MKITSPAFHNGGTIPENYTCEGANINPPLKFDEIPTNAKSLVLMVEDPDAAAKPWVHWLVYNIPPASNGFKENSIPEGAQEGICNGGTFGYEGPCPSGENNYLFKLYALDTELTVPKDADRARILKEMQGHILSEAVLIGKYKKQKVAENQS